MTVYYPCCRSRYELPIVGDQARLEAVIDAQHDAEHPRCSGANPPWTEVTGNR